MDDSNFKAGAAKVKTTPPLGTRINGDFITHYATYINDDLYSKALVLKRDRETIAIVVVDICIMPIEFIDRVKVLITKETGIAASNVLISSTHTHAAGSVADVHVGSLDPAYAAKLPELIVESVVLALSKLQPAKVGYSSVLVPEHLRCRRYKMKDGCLPINPVTGKVDQVKTNPFGLENMIDYSVAPTDPELAYLAVQGVDGSWISLLANYSLHYVGDWENGTISADYFGMFCNRLSSKLNESDMFVPILSNGTSGDVNIWDFMDPNKYPKKNFEKSKLIGEDLADRIIADLENVAWQIDPELSAIYEDVEVSVVKPTEKELIESSIIIATAAYENLVVDQDGLRNIYAREQLLLNEFEGVRTTPLQALKIGNGVIGALSGEYFSETGLYLKGNKKSKYYFTISMANGNIGYVPPAHEIEKGGYETWRCRYSCLVPGTEQMIRESLVKLMSKL